MNLFKNGFYRLMITYLFFQLLILKTNSQQPPTSEINALMALQPAFGVEWYPRPNACGYLCRNSESQVFCGSDNRVNYIGLTLRWSTLLNPDFAVSPQLIAKSPNLISLSKLARVRIFY
ncbi:hypothetical protein PPL_10684 [Heterostelium album PN500]|uniref:Uncharacterized protein n=1 Tax=Heterostelium pallidum (strain ATCC 26659 / Pp 5 / PN500) TaxID=670386 RepID=D3BRS3_HETP5|nr:hypothetical protein PPL_10684 [Heterostelium album PN500]EFA76105.1 hypothetical protein PPL_10684 [Heterostelium album PN500]|eukprot:XP_020428239.1 hypothetical protein PPL_10684 [Heterostelium album PN500]